MTLKLPSEDMEILDEAQGIIEKILDSFSSEDPHEPAKFGCTGCDGSCWGCSEAWRFQNTL